MTDRDSLAAFAAAIPRARPVPPTRLEELLADLQMLQVRVDRQGQALAELSATARRIEAELRLTRQERRA